MIHHVRAYRQEQPLRDGEYAMSLASSTSFDSLIVAVDDDEGLTGWGEIAIISPVYSEAFAGGARAGVAELAPVLLGMDSGQPRAVAERLDTAMRGQRYIKAALDMACWDLAARRRGQPLHEALGGRFGEAVDLYNVVTVSDLHTSVSRARDLVARGYRRLQVKVGRDAEADADRLHAVREAVGPAVVLFADGNGGFTTAAARRFLRATRELDYTLEQPCATYEECRALRAACDRPLVLDESIESLADLLRAHRDGVADGVTVKLSRVGGITRAALIRDVAVQLGISVTVEDAGGASLDTAAIVHVSLATPERFRVHTCDFHNWVTVDNADGLPAPRDGRLAPPPGPGLGVQARLEELGQPLVDVG